eukprot:3626494-Pyramimonas_sp.AAC.1
MLTQRPRSAPDLEITVGGSCLGSPTITRWPPLRTRLTGDMVEWSSVVWPASSMTRRASWLGPPLCLSCFVGGDNHFRLLDEAGAELREVLREALRQLGAARGAQIVSFRGEANQLLVDLLPSGEPDETVGEVSAWVKL